MKFTIPESKKEKRHGDLRALLARYQISLKEAAEFAGIPYGSFRESLRTDRFAEDTVEEIITKIENEMITRSIEG